jgi:uncharacterized SAM-binding protein YcdF (DUF218 family)
MYFIFSKILLFLLFPLNWIILLVIIAIISKRPKLKKRCFIAGFAMLILFTNPYLLYLFGKNWDVAQPAFDKGRIYSAVIVLGGFSGEDKNGNGFFNESADRFIEALRINETAQASHILVSSGNGNLIPSDFREAMWVSTVLKEFHLPDSAVLIEQNSRNTFENAAFSKALLLKKHLLPPYLLVTSSWHMRRAAYIFKKQGVDIIPYPSGRITGNEKFTVLDGIMPDAAAMVSWNFYLKELVGYVVAHVQ